MQILWSREKPKNLFLDNQTRIFQMTNINKNILNFMIIFVWCKWDKNFETRFLAFNAIKINAIKGSLIFKAKW